MSHLPRWLGARSAVAAGLVAYSIEKYLRKTLHPTLGQALGFHSEFVRAQECAHIEDLADLILQSSSTPPFTPILHRNGRPVLDNVPVSALDDAPGRVLVMVTRLYPRERMFVVPHGAQQRLYMQPSRKVPISSWDYTSPSQMQHAYDLGRADADNFLARLPRLVETAAHV